MSRNLLGDFQRHLCSQLRTSSFAAAEPWNVRKVARFCLNLALMFALDLAHTRVTASAVAP